MKWFIAMLDYADLTRYLKKHTGAPTHQSLKGTFQNAGALRKSFTSTDTLWCVRTFIDHLKTLVDYL